MKTLVVCLLAATVSIAAAAERYTLTLFQESIVAGNTLKAGDYKLTVDGDKAVITRGRDKVETPVKVETNGTKYNSTSVRYQNGDGAYRISEIRLGGTHTKLVFSN